MPSTGGLGNGLDKVIPWRERFSILWALTGLLVIATGIPCPAGEAVTFHVFARWDGDDQTGTRERPFRTIARAQQAVRQALAADPGRDVTVLIHDGNYYLDAPLRFGLQDSGAPGHPVTYRGESAKGTRIIGGRKLDHWERVSEGVWRTPVKKGCDASALFENGKWCTSARTPNTGYFRAMDGSNPTSSSTVVFRPRDIVKPFDATHAQVAIWGGRHYSGVNYNWFETLNPIAGIDWSSHTLRLARQTFWLPSPNNRYFLQGAREFLDAPGEFFIDSEAGWVYYAPRRRPIQFQEILLPTVKNAIEIFGEDKGVVPHDIAFENLSIEVSDSVTVYAQSGKNPEYGLVNIMNARNIALRGCRLRNGGYNNLFIQRRAQGHEISNCLIERAGFCAINLSGYDIGAGAFSSAADAYVSHGNRILNNYIRDCGRRVGHGAGIWIYQSGDNEIAHNLMENMPRHGIHMGGMTYGHLCSPQSLGGWGGRLYGQAVTLANHLDFLYARRNMIHHNEFRGLMANSSDGGAINAWGVGAGNVIDHNLIYAMKAMAADSMLMGIYLDDGAKDFTVTNNIITRLGGSSDVYPMCIKGQNNHVENNIIAGNEMKAAILSVAAGTAGLPDSVPGVQDEPVGNLIYRRNLIARNQGNSIYELYPWKDTMIRESDYNLYHHPDGVSEVRIAWLVKSWKDWLGRAGGKYERHSIYDDPRFRDPAAMDFRLRPDSPARALGFQEIDQTGEGLEAGFPFLAQVKQADRRYRPVPARPAR